MGAKRAEVVDLEKHVCIAYTLLRGHSQLSPAKSHVMQERPNVFISTTTADLGSYRLAVRDTLLDQGVHPILQNHLEPDYQTLLDILRREINACDAVICLVGYVYGQEPKNRPAGAPRRSYTQLEFDIAEAFGKPIYVFLADAQCKFDPHQEELLELRQLQQEYHEQLRQRPHKRESFRTLDDLRYKIATIRFADPGAIASKPQNLPYLSLGSHFKGREAFLTDLHQRFMATPGAAAAIVARQAIHGLGGVGKTRLAVEYAWRYQADYTALLFVFADTPANLRRNLAALTEPLRLPQQEAQEEDVRVAAVLHWLEDKNGWLLVLDNVDTDAVAQAVEHLLPRLQRGHVLITSRLTHWHSVEPLPLDVLAEPDAVAFLLERTAGFRYATPQDEADAVTLARTLGGLALALEQAGAYMQHLRCGLGEYLARWRSQEARVRTWFDERLMHYPRNVAVTWETTLAQLDEPAHALLRLLAWLAPDPIPRALFHSTEADQVFAAAVAGPGGNAPLSEVSLEEALAALTKYSMVQWTDVTSASLQVHRLVQEITRGRLPEDAQHFWLEQALRLVNAALPDEPPPQDVRSWPMWDSLRPHVALVVTQADQEGIPAPTARLINALGVFLKTKCMFAEAEPLYQRALAITEAAYGLTHPMVASVLNNLAGLLQATNRLAEAEPLYQRALAITEAAYGLTHPMVATHLNNLAELLRVTNRLAEAEPLHQRALAITEAAYGPTHPEVATHLNNLALLLQATNRLAEAEPLYQRALAITEVAYGPTHPMVATHLNNLAELLRVTNRLAEAEPLYQRALAIREAAYGPTHPEVATSLHNLALLLEATNRPAEAEPLYQRTLAIDEAAYGPTHPEVATDLNNLAGLLQATNRLAEAEPLYQRALAIDEAAYGPTHPTVAIRLDNLALLLWATDRLAEAEPLYQRALAITEAAYGPTHPMVATHLHNLAVLLQTTNRLAEAEPLYQRALAIDEAAYGPTHPTVAIRLNNLVGLLRATNRLAEAEPLMQRTMSILKHFNDSTGREHPHWQVSLVNYNSLLQAIGLSEAEIARRLQDVAGHPTSHNASSHAPKGFFTRLRRGITRHLKMRPAR